MSKHRLGIVWVISMVDADRWISGSKEFTSERNELALVLPNETGSFHILQLAITLVKCLVHGCSTNVLPSSNYPNLGGPWYRFDRFHPPPPPPGTGPLRRLSETTWRNFGSRVLHRCITGSSMAHLNWSMNGTCWYIPIGHTPETWLQYGFYTI